MGRGYYQNLNFSFLGQVFQYYLLDFKACWLRFASFGISAQVLKLGFLSLYLLFTIIIMWETAKVPLKKKRFGCFYGHLSFWVSGVELPLIFYTNIYIYIYIWKTKYIYETELFLYHWLNKTKHIWNFEKLHGFGS